MDRRAGDRTGRKKREGCWGGEKGRKFPEKRQRKSRGAEDEVIRGDAKMVKNIFKVTFAKAVPCNLLYNYETLEPS